MLLPLSLSLLLRPVPFKRKSRFKRRKCDDPSRLSRREDSFEVKQSLQGKWPLSADLGSRYSDYLVGLSQPPKISPVIDLLNEGTVDAEINCVRFLETFMEGNDFRLELLSSRSRTTNISAVDARTRKTDLVFSQTRASRPLLFSTHAAASSSSSTSSPSPSPSPLHESLVDLHNRRAPYVPVPGIRWKLALWRYRPSPEVIASLLLLLPLSESLVQFECQVFDDMSFRMFSYSVRTDSGEETVGLIHWQLQSVSGGELFDQTSRSPAMFCTHISGLRAFFECKPTIVMNAEGQRTTHRWWRTPSLSRGSLEG